MKKFLQNLEEAIEDLESPELPDEDEWKSRSHVYNNIWLDVAHNSESAIVLDNIERFIEEHFGEVMGARVLAQDSTGGEDLEPTWPEDRVSNWLKWIGIKSGEGKKICRVMFTLPDDTYNNVHAYIRRRRDYLGDTGLGMLGGYVGVLGDYEVFDV